MIHQIDENSFRKIFGKTSEKGNHEDSFRKIFGKASENRER